MQTAYRYPQDDLDKTGQVLGSMGTLWEELYEGNDVTETYVYGMTQLERQAFNDMREAVDCIARRRTPVFHTELWRELVLRQSDLVRGSSVLRYGEGGTYGFSYQYGVPAEHAFYAFPLDDKIRRVPLITNRITEPSRTLVDGLDFYLDAAANLVVFRSNPFDDANFAKREVYGADGAVSDYEISLWVYHSQWDRRLLFTQHGYPWGIELPSSQTYKDFLNALWDAAVRGTTAQDVYGAIAAALDVPLARGDETVEVVARDGKYLLIVTDQQVYRFNPNATLRYAVGDKVRKGYQLTDAVRFFEFNRGIAPSELTALRLDKNFLIDGYYSGVVFENREVPLEVTSDGIFTRVSFQLGGWPLDIDKFWEDFHQRGLADGRTLAHLLDKRANKVGEPTARDLPTTINPLEFLCANVLRNHGFAVKVRTNALGLRAAPLTALRALRRLVPAHTTMLLVVELEADPDLVTMDATSGMYTEDASAYRANPPDGEDVDRNRVSEGPELYYVGGRCI